MRPQTEIAGCRASHAALNTAIASLSDADVRRPSLLPGWSIGHLLTHVARNADSVVQRLDAAVQGRVVDQYEGGFDGRAAAIEAGASRSAADLISDVHRSSAAVDDVFHHYPDDAWDRPTRGVEGVERPAHTLGFSRWREVEVHLVDLGLGYLPADWPASLVELWLPGLIEGLPSRADNHSLMAWIIGRAGAPELAAWG